MPARAVSSPTASTRPGWPSRSTRCRPRPGRRRPWRPGLDSPVIIDSSSSAAPSTISPSAGTRPPERTSTTSPGAVTDRDRLDGAVVADALGLVGQQRGQGGERVLGLAERLHLLPVAEQHDRDQGAELPPEVEVEPVERRGHRRDVGDRDRHRDQQHHPGLAGPPRGAAGQERPAAPEEHDRAEHRADPLDAGEVELVAEPVHDHVAGDHHRHGQQQAPPEPRRNISTCDKRVLRPTPEDPAPSDSTD
jgi:hypothetical protein